MINNLNNYFDYAATTPMHPRVVTAMYDFMKDDNYFSNAQATHMKGVEVNKLIQQKTDDIYNVLGVRSHDLYITSGATESINWVLRSFRKQAQEKPRRILSSRLEHKATTEVLKSLNKIDYIEYIETQSDGATDLNHLELLLKTGADLVSIMHVNNEIGVINDIEKISFLCKEKGVAFHVDASQSVGKLALEVVFKYADFITVSGHKFYGPKGIGGLFVSRKHSLTPFMYGGGNYLRPGTIATHQVVGFAEAFSLISELESDANRIKELSFDFREKLKEIDDLTVVADSLAKVPHIMSITIPGVQSKVLQKVVQPYAISLGSSCNSTQEETSQVLRTMGLSDGLAASTFRLSFGLYTEKESLNNFFNLLSLESKKLRLLSKGAPDWCQKGQNA